MVTPDQVPTHIPVEGGGEQPIPIEVELAEHELTLPQPVETFESPGIIAGLKATVRSLRSQEGLADAHVLTGARSNNAHNIARDAKDGNPVSIDGYTDQLIRTRARAVRKNRQGEDFYRGKGNKDSGAIL